MNKEKIRELKVKLMEEYPPGKDIAFVKYEPATEVNKSGIVFMNVRNIGRCGFMTMRESYPVDEILDQLRIDIFHKLTWLANKLLDYANQLQIGKEDAK
jgi:hypothetical protein